MQRKQQLERLIRSLVETINGTIRRSGQIRDIMKEIEQHGYEIHLSLLAGIVLRDRAEEDDDLADIFSDDDSFEAEEFEGFDEDDTLDFFGGEIFTDEDLQFLISLGLSPD